MFSIIKEWKEGWDVDLADLHTWLQTNVGENYKGSSADYVLTLWFGEEPDGTTKTAIDSHWDGLTEEGEAAKIATRLAKDAAVQDALAAIPSLDWNDMIAAERKLIMNRNLTEDDRTALLVKYPQT